MKTTTWNIEGSADRRRMAMILLAALAVILLGFALLPRAAAGQTAATTAQLTSAQAVRGVPTTEVRYRPYYRRGYGGYYARRYVPGRYYAARPYYGRSSYAPYAGRPYASGYYNARSYRTGYRATPYYGNYGRTYGWGGRGFGYGYGW